MGQPSESLSERDPRYRPDKLAARRIGDLEEGTLVRVFPATPGSIPFDAQIIARREIQSQPRNPQVIVRRKDAEATYHSLGGGMTVTPYASMPSSLEGVDPRKMETTSGIHITQSPFQLSSPKPME